MNNELINEIDFENENDAAIMNPKEISALFNLLNGKPDSIFRIFPRDIKVSFDDLECLKQRIDEKLEHFEVLTSIHNISVKFENSTFKEFSNWIMFKNHNWRGSNAIDNITIKWDFMIKLNEYNFPQRHTVVVRISSGLKPQQLLQMMLSGQVEDLDSIDKNLVPVVCKVDFINNLLGDEIINIVEEWNKGLKTSYNSSKSMIFMRKNRVRLANLIKTIIPTFILVTLVVIFNKFIETFSISSFGDLNIKSMQSLVWFIVISCIIFNISKYFSMILAKKFHDSLYHYGGMHTFDITYGDRNKQEQIESDNKLNKKNTIISLCISIAINIMCGIISSYIFINIQ